jgi:long-subunit acyl-CoA synthetase (AMP-forming)
MIIRIFSAAGIPIREAYGLTEASPGISVSLFQKNKGDYWYGRSPLATDGSSTG